MFYGLGKILGSSRIYVRIIFHLCRQLAHCQNSPVNLPQGLINIVLILVLGVHCYGMSSEECSLKKEKDFKNVVSDKQ